MNKFFTIIAASFVCGTVCGQNARFDIPMESSVNARYVKINMTELSSPAWGDPANSHYQLAETRVLSEGNNVALGCQVTGRQSWELAQFGWCAAFLTDGIIDGINDKGYTSCPLQDAEDKTDCIVIDLGAEYPVDAIELYPRQDIPSLDACHVANFPASFSIETSTDNENYTMLYAAQNMESPYFNITGHEADFSAWSNVQSLDELSEGSQIKIKEHDGSRFFGTSDGNPLAEGKFVTGSTQAQSPLLTITDFSGEDGTMLLWQAESDLYWAGHGNWRGLISWSSMPDRWALEFDGGIAKLCNLSNAYCAFCDGGAESGIATDVSWDMGVNLSVLRQCDMNAELTEGSEMQCIISALQTGAYELITLPYDVKTLPAGYSFHQLASSTETSVSVLEAEAQSLVAGQTYLMHYDGDKAPYAQSLTLDCIVPATAATYSHQVLPWNIEVIFLSELPEVPVSIQNVTSKHSTTIYDLQGRRLTQAPARGMYIQNGKVMMK